MTASAPRLGDTAERTAFWEKVHTRRAVDAVSWWQAVPDLSLDLVAAAALGPHAPVIDVGAGSSTLVDHLHARGATDLTAVDLSQTALGTARERLGREGRDVAFEVADVLDLHPRRRYALWHDRAVYHFLTAPADRAEYHASLDRTLEPGGYAVVVTFGPDGPTTCSGLPVCRYTHAELAAQFDGYELVQTARADHVTPGQADQQFIGVLLRRSEGQGGAAVDALLEHARSVLARVPPEHIDDEVAAGAVLVDVRPVDQRTRDGAMPGAVVVDRNVLEWRLDPSSPHRLPVAVDRDVRYVLVCNQGYSSSLAAATLQQLGLHRATDLVGGFQAWLAWRDAR
jgi:rhodanese-related sulfurtransferase/2-polyprenyl-3-methyl-5-hydroxy-6-metoxy-1,4-benzoquinol methylase